MGKKQNSMITDRAKGCLLGMDYADIDGGTSHMALLVFQSLVENDNIGGDKIDYSDIGRRYLEWYNNNAVDTGIVNAMVFDLVNEGVTFEEASKEIDKRLNGMTASSRPACRSLPISVYLAGIISKNPDKLTMSILKKFIEQEVKLTHRHNHASRIAIAVNFICICLMLDYSLNESVKSGADFTSQKTRRSLGLTLSPIPITKKDLKNTGYADDALIAAIWFIRNTDSFDEAINESMKLKGKSNYCSVLVGAIGGALYGYFDIKSTIGKSGTFKYYNIESLTL
ncbi:MAG: ADP-ribosylglycohydrolase family protein [Candidatus Brocadiales bacterium]|nr:ADP-ribosylglycohydrolase family protein [Candidatus Brocadiales bacterium]